MNTPIISEQVNRDQIINLDKVRKNDDYFRIKRIKDYFAIILCISMLLLLVSFFYYMFEEPEFRKQVMQNLSTQVGVIFVAGLSILGISKKSDNT